MTLRTGYLTVAYDQKAMTAALPGHEAPISLRVGNALLPDEVMTLSREPVAIAPEMADGKAVLLQLEFQDQDVVDSNAENLQVRIATIIGISFINPEDNLQLGHRFDPVQVEARRKTFRRDSLLSGEFPRKYVVLRAMSKEVSHLFPMDYAYISSGSVVKTMAKRVVDAYVSGDRSKLYSSTEKSLMLTLDHAATMALSQSEPQHVTVAVVDNKHLYRASNEGEFFYDAINPHRVESLIDVSAEGAPSLSATAPAKQRLLSPGL